MSTLIAEKALNLDALIADQAKDAEGLYLVNFSSDPSVIKNLMMRVAYELHLGYQEAKAALMERDPDGKIDLRKISLLNRMIQKSEVEKVDKQKENKNETPGALLRDQLEKEVKRLGEGKIDAIYEMMNEYLCNFR